MEHPEKWSVVVIDDEEDIRDVLSIVLQDSGYSVATAEDGKSGLILIATSSISLEDWGTVLGDPVVTHA
ncbi:MAG: hypothetical protein HQK66_13345, partial [Desulfamplus sp.]|nr:hypothetical protein [Desulfamplus sp.]